jgi:hypothetical protein
VIPVIFQNERNRLRGVSKRNIDVTGVLKPACMTPGDGSSQWSSQQLADACGFSKSSAHRGVYYAPLGAAGRRKEGDERTVGSHKMARRTQKLGAYPVSGGLRQYGTISTPQRNRDNRGNAISGMLAETSIFGLCLLSALNGEAVCWQSPFCLSVFVQSASHFPVLKL